MAAIGTFGGAGLSALNPMVRGVSQSALNPMPHGGPPTAGAASDAQPGGTSALVAEALFTSRAALAVLNGETLRDPPLLKKIVEPLWHWSPEVRADVFQFDLLQLTHFEPASCALVHNEVTAPNGTGAGQPQKIVSMSRPSHQVLRDQSALVAQYVDERGDRMAEILSQADTIWPFWSAITNIDALRTPKTVELLANALAWASVVTMRFKHELACPRPVDYSPSLQPVIPTPGHGSIPSGHATASYLFVEVVQGLLGLVDKDPMLRDLRRLAYRVAENRTVAGLHFPCDNIAGRLLGEALGGYFVALNSKAPKVLPATFNGASVKKGSSLQMSDDESQKLDKKLACEIDTAVPLRVSTKPIIHTLWLEAIRELELRGYIAATPLERPTTATRKRGGNGLAARQD